VVIVRERNGNSIPAVFKSEAQAIAFISGDVAKGTLVNADDAAGWNELHAKYEMKRINHEEAYWQDGACTNWAEEFFQPHAPRRDRPSPPYREKLFAPVRARDILARR
jgi:hypothetical protein